MPTLMIQGTEISYEEKDIVTFTEGLIGLPKLRRMVIARQSNIEPFLWLVSLDEEGVGFVVADAPALFPSYAPVLPSDSHFRETMQADDSLLILTIVRVANDWQQSTANLRAPIFISANTMKGAQLVLPDAAHSVGELLPMAMAA